MIVQIEYQKVKDYLKKFNINGLFLRSSPELHYLLKDNNILIAIGDPGYGIKPIVQLYSAEKRKMEFETLYNLVNTYTKLPNILNIYKSNLVDVQGICNVKGITFNRYHIDNTFKSEFHKPEILTNYDEAYGLLKNSDIYIDKQIFDKNLFICKRQNNEVVAICGTHYISTEKNLPTLCGFLFVKEEFRRLKIGNSMVYAMNNIIQSSVNSATCWDISKENISSQNLFLKLGALISKEEFNFIPNVKKAI